MYESIKKALGPLLEPPSVKTTGLTFKLLTHVTVCILLVFATLVSLSNIFGTAIECSIQDGSIKKIVETKCWIEGVYVDRTLLGGTIGKDITRYGVGSSARYNQNNFINQKYYQWIIPVLALQALIMSLPRFAWHTFENGLISKLVAGSDDLIVTDKWKTNKTLLVRFLLETPVNFLRLIAIKCWMCEIAALGALIFNMSLMNWVFNNFWVEYLPTVRAFLEGDPEQFSRSAARLFPTQAKCLYNEFGPSGGQQSRDALCFLPQNTINEKIFVFLYFWFILMLIVGILHSLVSTILLFTIPARKLWIRYRLSRSTDQNDRLAKGFSDIGSFFLLTRLSMNLSHNLFKDFLDELAPYKKKSELVGASV